MELRKVGIVGAGPVAASLAQLCVQNGLEVLLLDATDEALGWAEDRILRGLHQVEQPSAFGLVRKGTDLRGLGDCDMALETDCEGFEARKELLGRIDAYLPLPRALAVNTAVVPVALLAAGAENPDRVIGMRFFLPASVMRLVELAAPEQAQEGCVRAALELAKRLGRSVVRTKDAPGFVVSRVSRPFYLAALRLLEQGRGTPDAVDKALRSLAGLPLGPFEMLDHIGLEEDMRAAVELYELSGRPERLRPSGLLEKLVARGCRGRRNSRGFYLYGENPPGTVNPLLQELAPGLGSRPTAPQELVATVLSAVAAEAGLAAGESVATLEDIDTAMRLAMGWPKGPGQWARGTA